MASLIFLLENAGELRLIILRREKGKSPSNPTDTTNTHFYAPTATRITFAPVTKLHKATTTKLFTLNTGGGQSRMIALEPQP